MDLFNQALQLEMILFREVICPTCQGIFLRKDFNPEEIEYIPPDPFPWATRVIVAERPGRLKGIVTQSRVTNQRVAKSQHHHIRMLTVRTGGANRPTYYYRITGSPEDDQSQLIEIDGGNN